MRKLVTILIILGACLAAAVSPVWTQNTRTGEQGFVEGLVQTLLSSEANTVKVFDLAIGLSGNVTAGRIELHDQRGSWLVFEDASIDWKPFSLLGDTLEVKELRAARIGVMRLPLQLPEPEAPEEAANLGGVVVERLAIGQLDVDSAVFGHALRVAAEGLMTVSPDRQKVMVELSAQHTDGVPGRFDASVSYDGASNELSVDIALAEPKGGVTAALLPLDDAADIELRIVGAGKIDDWTGRLSFSADDETVVDGRARISGRGEDYALSLDLAGAVDALTPDGLDDLFAGRSELSLTALYSADKPVRIEQAELKTGAVSLSAKGSIDLQGTDTSLQIGMRTLSADTLSITVPGTSLGELGVSDVEASVFLQGAIERPDWSLEAQASAISAADVTVRSLDLEASGTGFVPSPETASTLDVAVNGTIDPQREEAIPPLLAGGFSATFGLRLADNEIALTGGRIEARHYDLAATGRYGHEDATFELEVDLKAESPETGNPVFDRVLRGPVGLSGGVTGRSLDRIDFDDVSFSSTALEARIDGRYDIGGDTDLTASATLSHLGHVHESIKGSLAVSARLAGQFDRLKIDVTGRGEQVAVAGRALNDLKLAVGGTFSEAAANLDISLDGVFVEQPFQLDARLLGDDTGSFRLDDITGSLGPATIGGTIGLSAAGMPEGAITLSVTNLAELSDPALQGLQGSVEAQVVLVTESAQSIADIHLLGHGLAGHGAGVSELDVRLEVADMLGSPQVSGSGLLNDTRFGQHALGNLEIDLAAASHGRYKIDLRDYAGLWMASSTLGVRTEGPASVLEIDTIQARFGGTAVSLAKPATLRLGPDAVELSHTEFAVGSGTLVVAGTVSPALSLQAKFAHLPLTVLEPAFPDLGLQGHVSGTVAATGSTDAPQVTARVNGTGVTIAAVRGHDVLPVSFELSGELRDEIVSLRGRVREKSASLTVSGTIDLAPQGNVDVAIAGDLSSGLLARLGSRNGLIVKGAARVAAKVRGPVDNISYSGTITLSGATIGDSAGRFIARDVAARLLLDSRTLRVEQFSGTTAGGAGRVAARGVIGLQDGVQSDLAVTVNGGRFTDGTLLVTLFDARLTLRGAQGSPLTLAGAIELKNPKITLNEPLPATLAPLSVEHRRPPREVQAQLRSLDRGGDAGSARSLNIDLQITTAEPILVTGRGINAELGGSLRLTGPAGAPRASGAFRLRRGSVKLLSRKVELTRGELDFSGNLNPQVNFAGVARTDRATITLAIVGPADAPSVTVSSAPDLPQEEALALLVFGRSITELAPLQVAQMAGSVAMLSGGSGGGLFDGLKEIIGSTNIEMVRTESGESAVSIGRRLNDRLTVGVQQETGTGKRRIEIDLELTRRLKLRGSVGDDRSTKAGVFFEKEY